MRSPRRNSICEPLPYNSPIAHSSFSWPLMSFLKFSSSLETISSISLSLKRSDFAMVYPLPDFCISIIVFPYAQEDTGILRLIHNPESRSIHQKELLCGDKCGPPVATFEGMLLHDTLQQHDCLIVDVTIDSPARCEHFF